MRLFDVMQRSLIPTKVDNEIEAPDHPSGL